MLLPLYLKNMNKYTKGYDLIYADTKNKARTAQL
jgi:hypothetical protein